MLDNGQVRAELVTDDAVGALLRVVTYGADGEVYCERRFIAFDTGVPTLRSSDTPSEPTLQAYDSSGSLPEQLGGFARLDSYEDDDGFVFGYYSDGFFSFAVFETPSVVRLNESSEVTFDESTYGRAFTPGQVTYSWETPNGGLALIGDLPPDMHPEILAGLPDPHAAGIFRRIWRSLFG
jgi:negative regulator of sigma E activity